MSGPQHTFLCLLVLARAYCWYWTQLCMHSHHQKPLQTLSCANRHCHGCYTFLIKKKQNLRRPCRSYAVSALQTRLTAMQTCWRGCCAYACCPTSFVLLCAAGAPEGSGYGMQCRVLSGRFQPVAVKKTKKTNCIRVAFGVLMTLSSA